MTADLLLNPAIIVEGNRKFMQFQKRRAAFEGYQRIAENDIMESQRKNYTRIVNVRTFFLSCTYEVTTRIYKNQLPYLESEIEIILKIHDRRGSTRPMYD